MHNALSDVLQKDDGQLSYFPSILSASKQIFLLYCGFRQSVYTCKELLSDVILPMMRKNKLRQEISI